MNNLKKIQTYFFFKRFILYFEILITLNLIKMLRIVKTSVIVLFFLIAANLVQAAFPTSKVTSEISVNQGEASLQKPTTSTSTKLEIAKPLAQTSSSGTGGKNKTLAAVLAFLVGGLGVHSFYMGQTLKGGIQLGGSVLGIVLFISGVSGGTLSATALIGYLLLLGVSIWAFVDFIRILTGGLEPEEGWD